MATPLLKDSTASDVMRNEIAKTPVGRIAEMEEIAAFVGPGQTGDGFYQAAAALYERIAADFEGARAETGALDAFCEKAGS